jgi:lipid-A-disaccharide synthase
MVAAYRLSLIEELAGRLMFRLSSPILTNIVLGEDVVPCFLQHHCTPENLSAALLPLLADGPARTRQIEAFQRLGPLLAIGGETPSNRAARVVLEAHAAKIGRSPANAPPAVLT